MQNVAEHSLQAALLFELCVNQALESSTRIFAALTGADSAVASVAQLSATAARRTKRGIAGAGASGRRGSELASARQTYFGIGSSPRLRHFGIGARRLRRTLLAFVSAPQVLLDSGGAGVDNARGVGIGVYGPVLPVALGGCVCVRVSAGLCITWICAPSPNPLHAPHTPVKNPAVPGPVMPVEARGGGRGLAHRAFGTSRLQPTGGAATTSAPPASRCVAVTNPSRAFALLPLVRAPLMPGGSNSSFACGCSAKIKKTWSSLRRA
jgi:hypothetical protein